MSETGLKNNPLRYSHEEYALLLEIRNDREEDFPRLVYADWLDESGRVDQAELIRLECEVAKLARDSEEAREIRGRLVDLKLKLIPSLFKPVARIAGKPVYTKRGVFEVISTSRNTQIADMEGMGKIVLACPTIVELHLDSSLYGTDLSAYNEWLLRIEELHLKGGLADRKATSQIARCGGFANLKSLNLRRTTIDAVGFDEVFCSKSLRSLERLEVSAMDLFFGGSLAAKGPLWRQLKSIQIVIQSLGSVESARAMAQSVEAVCQYSNLREIGIRIVGDCESLRKEMYQLTDARIDVKAFW